jgi:hypothetical protein
LLFESNHAELAAGLRFENSHYAIVFDFRLEMSILRWLLPKRVDFRLARGFDYVSETLHFCLEHFHERKSPPENYGKEDQTTVAAFLPWRGSSALNP